MSNIAAIKAKFAHRIAIVDADVAAREATNTGNGPRFYRVKPEPDSRATVRFMPGIMEADGKPSLTVIGYKQHFIPGQNGKARAVVCLSTFGARCPICELHEEALRVIGAPPQRAKPGSTKKEYQLPGDKYPNGMEPRSLYLTQVCVLSTDEIGVSSWDGPQPMEMSSVLFEKIFGLEWKQDTYKSRLTAQSELSVFDIFDSYSVHIQGANAPTFYNVKIISDRSGAHIHGPLFDGPDAEAKFEQLMSKLIDLRTLIVRPSNDVIEHGASVLRQKLDDAILAMHGGPVEVNAEAEEAYTAPVQSAPRAQRAALEAPVVDTKPATTRQRAADLNIAAALDDADDI
jgi:hypothetical protein